MSPQEKAKLESIDREPSPLVDKAHSLSIQTSFVDNRYNIHFIEDEVLKPIIKIQEKAKEDSKSIEELDDSWMTPSSKTLQNTDNHKHKGVWLQLYSLLSENSLGIGDFRDLYNFTTEVSKYNIDFIQINPINAVNLSGHFETSPYMPISRFFLNPLYLRPSWTEDFENLDQYKQSEVLTLEHVAARNNENINRIDYEAVRTNKLQILEYLFTNLVPFRGEKLERFIFDGGEELDLYCEYQVRRARKNASNEIRLQKKFYAYLEMLTLEQLAQCKMHCEEMGLKIGIITDIPVGCHPFGADPEIYKGAFIRDLSVGAPPDAFNQMGQNWGLNPMNKFYLEKTSYKPYRDLFKKVFSYSGAIRIDHVIGLFRLWCIPPNVTADKGAYIVYDYHKIFEILQEVALEAGAIIIGEDLGTVPSYVRPFMKEKGLLRTQLMIQQSPETVVKECLLTVLTHDHPPLKSWISGNYIDFYNTLGLIPDYEKTKETHKENVVKFLKGFDIDPKYNNDELTKQIYKKLFTCKAKLKAISLLDIVGQKVSVNIPGTSDEYQNWAVPLKDSNSKNVLLENLFNLAIVKEIMSYSI